MRLTDKDKFIKALDFQLYGLHYPYDTPPFNDWTEEQKKTATFFITHIRNMMEQAPETDAISIERLLSILPIPYNETMEDSYSQGYVDGWNACLKVIKKGLEYWEKENGLS